MLLLALIIALLPSPHVDPIELADVINVFLVPTTIDGKVVHANMLGWDAGASAGAPAGFQWQTQGLENGKKPGLYARRAKIPIAVDGIAYEYLRDRVEALDWSLTLSGTDAGPHTVSLSSGKVLHQPIGILAYLLRHHMKAKVIQCAGKPDAMEALYDLESPGFKPARFFAKVSCESGSICSQTYELGYFATNISDLDDDPMPALNVDACQDSKLI